MGRLKALFIRLGILIHVLGGLRYLIPNQLFWYHWLALVTNTVPIPNLSLLAIFKAPSPPPPPKLWPLAPPSLALLPSTSPSFPPSLPRHPPHLALSRHFLASKISPKIPKPLSSHPPPHSGKCFQKPICSPPIPTQPGSRLSGHDVRATNPR